MHGLSEKDWNYLQIGIAIIISFACYLPVVLAGHLIPSLGWIMLPKTLADLWIIIIGYVELRIELRRQTIVSFSTTKEETLLSDL